MHRGDRELKARTVRRTSCGTAKRRLGKSRGPRKDGPRNRGGKLFGSK